MRRFHLHLLGGNGDGNVIMACLKFIEDTCGIHVEGDGMCSGGNERGCVEGVRDPGSEWVAWVVCDLWLSHAPL